MRNPGIVKGAPRFALSSRVRHGSMAAMALTMLIIGVAMVASLMDFRHWIHPIPRE